MEISTTLMNSDERHKPKLKMNEINKIEGLCKYTKTEEITIQNYHENTKLKKLKYLPNEKAIISTVEYEFNEIPTLKYVVSNLIYLDKPIVKKYENYKKQFNFQKLEMKSNRRNADIEIKKVDLIDIPILTIASIKNELNKNEIQEKIDFITVEDSVIYKLVRNINDVIFVEYLENMLMYLQSKAKFEKEKFSENVILKEGDIFFNDPNQSDNSDFSFPHKNVVKIEFEKEKFQMKYHEVKEPKITYRLNNKNLTKPKITIHELSPILLNKNNLIRQNIKGEEHIILNDIFSFIINDCILQIENSITSYSEPKFVTLEKHIPQISKKDTLPWSPVYIKESKIWPSLPAHKYQPKNKNEFQKQILTCTSKILNKRDHNKINPIYEKWLGNNNDIPKDGIFGRDSKEPKFLNFCCNTCRTWINLGNRNQHYMTCVVKKGSITKSLRTNLQPRLITRMPGTVCFICGGRYTMRTISRHEKICLKKWLKFNQQLNIKYRKQVPIKPEIKNEEIEQRVAEQLILGNIDYTVEDAINDIYYIASRNNVLYFE